MRDFLCLVRDFLVTLITVILNVVFTIGLPFVLLIAGEALCNSKYPQGSSPFSGVGVLGAIATFALWCTWSERALKINIFAAVVRVILCYLIAFVPAFWLIKSRNPLGAGIFAALIYYLVGYAALNVWKKRTVLRLPGPLRGAGTDFPNQAGKTNPQTITQGSSPAETLSYEEIKRIARDKQSR